jgi:hypothetical protein
MAGILFLFSYLKSIELASYGDVPYRRARVIYWMSMPFTLHARNKQTDGSLLPPLRRRFSQPPGVQRVLFRGGASLSAGTVPQGQPVSAIRSRLHRHAISQFNV